MGGYADRIRVVLKFDSFGDLIDLEACLVDTASRAVVVANRKALGMPPQHSGDVGLQPPVEAVAKR
jgi:hypothetical protein